jgi:hypothetical protein
MTDKKRERPGIIEIQDEKSTDAKTGKTISKKAAMLAAGGSLLAGSSLGFGSSLPANDSIQVDTNNDMVADSLFTDENGDGIYETSEVIAVPDGPEAPETSPAVHPFDASAAPQASGINDEMSFSEAFASAREELGPGGVFSWHGQDYGTFYAEEVYESGNPIIEYDTAAENDYQNVEVEHQIEDEPQASNGGEEAPTEVHVLGLDNNADGAVETYVVDTNLDGSADALYVDGNLDGQITDEEVQIIHDPATLEAAAEPTDGSMISVDTNADGQDDVLLVDANSDLVVDAIGADQNQDMVIDENEVQILNEEAFQEAGSVEGTDEMSSDQVEYDGEVANDMPEDVPESELDNFSGDITNLEDNFTDYNEWV